MLHPRGRWLLLSTALCVALCAVLASRLIVREDVTSLMPTKPAALAEQFFLLREAPLLQGLTITVTGDDPANLAETLAAALRGPVIPRVFSGKGVSFSPEILTGLCAAAPGLMESDQLAALPRLLDDDTVQRTLERDARLLQTPKGLALRDLLAMDPLGICGKTLQRLAPASKGAGPRLESGRLLSADGRHALVFAEPAAPIGDSNASREVMTTVRKAVDALPPGAEVIVTGGDRHAEANADVIMNDVARVVPLSLVLLAFAYLIFVRTAQGLGIVLLPGAALAVAAACTGLMAGSLSGIVIGFGSVILGITADYAIHVYFAVRSGTSVARALDSVSGPLLIGAATTLAAFITFFLSAIPCVAGMAVFAVCGIIAAVILSLVVLPHCLTPTKGATIAAPHDEPARGAASGPRRIALLATWAVLVTALFFLFRNVPVNGDVRSLSYTSASIAADEVRTREIWGGIGDSGMFAVTGATLEDALKKNDAVWQALGELSREKFGFDRAAVTGLGGILPSEATQARRHEAWAAFWKLHGEDAAARVERFAAKAGFSPGAFAPFKAWINAHPAMVRPETLASLGLALPLQLARQTARGSIVYTMMPQGAPRRVLDLLAENGAIHVSGSTFREALSVSTRADLVRFGSLSLCAVVVMTVLMLRSFSRAAMALLPVAFGLCAVLAVFRAFGMSLNIFHAMALPLVMALSVDYGVFILARLEGTLEAASRRGVLLSGITTISGFGSLLLADHPALRSLGLTVALGLSCALLTALYILPRLAGPRFSLSASTEEAVTRSAV